MITSQEACTSLLEWAANPGMDMAGNPYTLARDYCAIIQNVLEALSRVPLLVLRSTNPFRVGDHTWRMSCYQDQSGILHRWILVDKWDEDSKYRALHSWDCFGDCAAARIGMSLHIIEIGRYFKGHQHTDWARAYRHPIIFGKYRFRKVDGSPLEKSWVPVWFQSSDKNNSKDWVNLMESDGLTHIYHLNINEPSNKHVEQFQREMEYEADRMMSLGQWWDVPMSRPACDFPYPCPWQDVCYAPPGIIDVDSIGGYTSFKS